VARERSAQPAAVGVPVKQVNARAMPMRP